MQIKRCVFSAGSDARSGHDSPTAGQDQSDGTVISTFRDWGACQSRAHTTVWVDYLRGVQNPTSTIDRSDPM
jgi:hypothetical protein